MNKKFLHITILSATLFLSSHALIPDILSQYVANPTATTYVAIASGKEKIANPTDLDFDRNGDLWVLNRGTNNSGGSTVKILAPGKPGQKARYQQDENAMHFMFLPTSMAFGDSGTFATVSGTLDSIPIPAPDAVFSGPTLWNSDSTIYAKPNPGNGSHIDMLHASPYSLGIAHEKANVYWVFDAYSQDIVRYDFGMPHLPGGSDHSDGIIRRYPEIPVAVVSRSIPSHLVMHKGKGWLYIVDAGHKRILRLNTSSGTLGGKPKYPESETVKEYVNMSGATWEIVTDKKLSQPSGIDILNNTLIVSEYSTGEIIFFDVTTLPAKELARISTGSKGITGISIGPDGRIWYVNALASTLLVAQPSKSTLVQNQSAVSAGGWATVHQAGRAMEWTVSTGNFAVKSLRVSIQDASGKLNYLKTDIGTETFLVNTSSFSSGLHFLILDDGKSRLIRTLFLGN